MYDLYIELVFTLRTHRSAINWSVICLAVPTVEVSKVPVLRMQKLKLLMVETWKLLQNQVIKSWNGWGWDLKDHLVPNPCPEQGDFH